ncbi:Gx transporter family protein [Massilistercora timonensis]|uniref:Gx transporter family protein n=1 Tax=Massilistercora timonensis TaxID=2086584 RepID=UPI00320B5367
MKNRVAYFGVFTALALIFSYVESLIPIQLGIPGVKLGLANLIIVIALYKMRLSEVFLLSIVRILLSGFLFGNYFSILYSLAGGLLSLAVMALLKKTGDFSVMGISMAGGVFHNVGQLVVAMMVVETFSVGYYLPVLLVAGLVTGFLIGVAAGEMLKRLVNIQFY